MSIELQTVVSQDPPQASSVISKAPDISQALAPSQSSVIDPEKKKEEEEKKKKEEEDKKKAEILKQKKIYGVIAFISFVLGIGLLIGYYIHIGGKSNSKNCKCKYLANELVGVFYGFLFGGILMLILGGVLLFKGDHKGIATIIMILGVILLISCIAIDYIANTLRGCDTTCGEVVETAPALDISGWIFTTAGIAIGLYALSL